MLSGRSSAWLERVVWDHDVAGSNPVAPTIFLASLFCGSFLGFTWFNRKVQFSLLIARLVTTSFAVVTWRVQILLPVWHGEPRPKNYLDDLSNSGPAVRQDSEGWELGPPEDRYIKGGNPDVPCGQPMRRCEGMGKLVFGMMQSLDGYVAGVAGGPGSDGYVAGLASGLELPPPGDSLNRHFNDHVRGLAGLLCGRRMYEVMRYWDE